MNGILRGIALILDDEDLVRLRWRAKKLGDDESHEWLNEQLALRKQALEKSDPWSKFCCQLRAAKNETPEKKH